MKARDSCKILERFERLSQEEQWAFKPAPDIEGHPEIFARLISFLCEMAVAYASKNVLIISHLDVMAALLIHLRKHPREIGKLAFMVILLDGVNLQLDQIKGIRFETLPAYEKRARERVRHYTNRGRGFLECLPEY